MDGALVSRDMRLEKFSKTIYRLRLWRVASMLDVVILKWLRTCIIMFGGVLGTQGSA